MKWSRSGPCAVVSDTGYYLSRSPQEGYAVDGRVCYTLSRHNAVIETRWCDDTDEDRERVRRELMALANE